MERHGRTDERGAEEPDDHRPPERGRPRFAIEAPAGWAVGAAPGFALATVAPPATDPLFRANLTVSVDRLDAEKDIVGAADRLLAEGRAGHQGFRLRQREVVDDEDTAGVAQVVNFDVPGADLTVAQVHVLVAHRQDSADGSILLFTLVGSFTLERHATDGRLVSDAIESFAVERVQPGSAAGPRATGGSPSASTRGAGGPPPATAVLPPVDEPNHPDRPPTTHHEQGDPHG